MFLGVGLRFATVDGNICLGVIAAVQFVVVERIVKVGRVERYRGCEVSWAVRLRGLRGCEVKRLRGCEVDRFPTPKGCRRLSPCGGSVRL